MQHPPEQLDALTDTDESAGGLTSLLEHGSDAAVAFARGGVFHLNQAARGTLEGAPPRELLAHLQDRGVGIAPEDQRSVFSPFVRGRNASGCQGSGVGLAIVRQLVERYHGRIELRSTPGQGSIFTLHFPESMSPES